MTPVESSSVQVFKPGFIVGTWAIYWKEIRVFFLSPLAYVFLAAFLFLSGLFFYMGLALTGEASLRPVMSNLAVVLLFCIPMLTMRQFSEEARMGTMELLGTVPVGLGSIIIGKWLACLSLCVLLLASTGVYPVILGIYGEPDMGILWTSYLGLFACCSAFTAAGIFTSSLAKDQMVAGVGAILALLPFWIVSSATELMPESLAPVLQRFSLIEHLRGFSRGVVDTADVLWFVSFTSLFLFFTWQALESRRWR